MTEAANQISAGLGLTAAPAAKLAIEPIHTHPAGPSSIDATEFGDTWHQAMTKINANFKKVVAAVSGGASALVAGIDNDARGAVTALESYAKSLESRIVILEGSHDDLLKALSGVTAAAPAAAVKPVAEPPVAQIQAAAPQPSAAPAALGAAPTPPVG